MTNTLRIISTGREKRRGNRIRKWANLHMRLERSGLEICEMQKKTKCIIERKSALTVKLEPVRSQMNSCVSGIEKCISAYSNRLSPLIYLFIQLDIFRSVDACAREFHSVSAPRFLSQHSLSLSHRQPPSINRDTNWADMEWPLDNHLHAVFTYPCIQFHVSISRIKTNNWV